MTAGKPTIINKSIPTANTEVSQVLPLKVAKLLIKLRSKTVDLKLAYASGGSGTTYVTIPAGCSKEILDIKGSITLYMQTTGTNQVAEIEHWQ